ncbi:hypothetical protein [Shewanella sp.]|uniref:hypothetical protein n=1 Tax=Shewanella sp. TaxID=50422 RepID=UPI0040476981
MDISNIIKLWKFNLIRKLLKNTNYEIQRRGVVTEVVKLYKSVSKKNYGVDIPNEIVSIVFSKDRAMQINAFLESYYKHVKNFGKVVIIYKATTEEHYQSYEDVINTYKEHNLKFIDEKNFREQLIETLNCEQSKKIIFYVDDMIFLRKFNYADLIKIDELQNVIALTRGADLNYSTVLNRKIEAPKFNNLEGEFLSFNWNESDNFTDWTYPIGVSGYMYHRLEILEMIKLLDFKAPNSLETALQVYKPIFSERLGICTKNAIAVCVHANLTQTEGVNPVISELNTDDLLNLWNKKKKINIDKYYNVPANSAQIIDYEFIER